MKLPAHSWSSTIAVHKGSHVIAKMKPKIKIVHIFAPEIIKTDVEHFRELVQRLTGKPVDTNTAKTNPPSPESCDMPSARPRSHGVVGHKVVKVELKEDIDNLWVGGSSGGSLSALQEEEDVLFEGLGDHFPFLPFSSWNMDVIGHDAFSS